MPVSWMRTIACAFSISHRNADLPSGRRELARVAEEIRDGLGDPHSVAVDEERAVRKLHFERLLGLLAEWAAGFDRLLESLAEIHPRPLQGQLAAADPGDIEEILDQAHEVAHLPIDRSHRQAR